MKKIAPYLVVLTLFGAIVGVIATTSSPTSQPERTSGQTSDLKRGETPPELIEATFAVEDSAFTLSLTEETSVLEAMNQLVEEGEPLKFSGSESEFGFFVESINGLENNTATNEYWSLYVNGNLSPTGVSDTIIQDEDLITWLYEEVSF